MNAIQSVRTELSDSDVNFPLLSDDEIQYFLDKNSSSIVKASIDCAKTILFKLAQQSDEVVNIFSIKGSKAAAEYREALKLYLKDATLNPVYSQTGAYASGISLEDMQVYQTTDSPIKSFDF